jgi:TetR/AcrR family transcriptional repressor of mexJK operon
MTHEILEIAEFKRGPGGRPSRAEAKRRHRALLETAARLFLDRGIDGVSLDEIARQAGVAKRSIYARYGDKSALFVAAIEHCFAERLNMLHAFEPSHPRAESGLIAFARKFLDLALDPDALALLRLFITAAPRFPGLARLFVERNRHRATGEVARVLAFYGDRGEIKLQDSQMMAEHFFSLVVSIPQRLALLGLRESPQQERRRLRAAIRLFLNGCRAKPRSARS